MVHASFVVRMSNPKISRWHKLGQGTQADTPLLGHRLVQQLRSHQHHPNVTRRAQRRVRHSRRAPVAYTSASAMDRRRLANAKFHTPVQPTGKSGLELRQLPKPSQHRSTFDRLRPIASRPPKFPKIQYGFGSISEPTRILPPQNTRFRQGKTT